MKPPQMNENFEDIKKRKPTQSEALKTHTHIHRHLIYTHTQFPFLLPKASSTSPAPPLYQHILPPFFTYIVTILN